MQQSPSFLILVSPDHFGFNSETAGSNSFQKEKKPDKEIINSAQKEFNHTLSILEEHLINFRIFPSNSAVTPDAVFPNNWFSAHSCGTIFLYPMMAENRRLERNADLISWIMKNFGHNRLIDLTYYENQNKFLEGTGSIVFHHPSKTAYACISPRTDEEILKKVCDEIGYSYYFFRAEDLHGKEIYHTNVMMAITTDLAIICSDSVADLTERMLIIQRLLSSGLEIIELSYSQMNSFAGNMFEVINKEGDKKLLMSETAYRSLTSDQLTALKKFTEPVPVPVSAIESIGGGSIRCMVAGIFSVAKEG